MSSALDEEIVVALVALGEWVPSWLIAEYIVDRRPAFRVVLFGRLWLSLQRPVSDRGMFDALRRLHKTGRVSTKKGTTSPNDWTYCLR